MRGIYDFFGGRKMFFSVLLLAIGATFVATDNADFKDFSHFIMWVFGIYSIGNVGSKAFNKQINK